MEQINGGKLNLIKKDPLLELTLDFIINKKEQKYL